MKENFLGKTYAGTFLLGVSNFNFQYSSILNGHLPQHVWLSVNYQHSLSFFFFLKSGNVLEMYLSIFVIVFLTGRTVVLDSTIIIPSLLL